MLHKFNQLFKNKNMQNATFSGAPNGAGDSFGSAQSGGMSTTPFARRKKASSGRSMVEMLGVLAIIGVLSIGGIAGFNYAMNRYRANELLNDVTIRAVDLIAQSSRGITLNLDAWDTHSKAGYLINNPASTKDGLVYMEAHDVPQKVCEIAFATAGDYISQIDIGGAKATSKNDCADTNTMAFYFDAKTTPGIDKGSSENKGNNNGDSNADPEPCPGGCPGKQECVNGTCQCTNGGSGENCGTGLCANVTCPECQSCDPNTGTCYTDFMISSCKNGKGICSCGSCIISCGVCMTPNSEDDCVPKPKGTVCGIGICDGSGTCIIEGAQQGQCQSWEMWDGHECVCAPGFFGAECQSFCY